MGVGGSVYAALVGAVLVEGQGLGRGLALLRGRWAAMCTRMLVLGGLCWAYSQASVWLVAQVVGAAGPGVIASGAQAVLTIPALVFQVVVLVVTYAELRGRVDGSGTGGLAAGLVGRRWSGSAAAVSSAGGRPATVIIAGRRRRGLRWMTPVLVLAVLLGAGGPLWAGSPAVVSAAAVSPVPMEPDGGAGGNDAGAGSGADSGSDAGTSISGSSDSGSDSAANSGDHAPEVASKNTPDDGASGHKSGDPAPVAEPAPGAKVESPSDSGAKSGSDPKVAGSGPAEDARQSGETDAKAARPPGTSEQPGQTDPTVAGSVPTPSAEPGSQVGATPASTADPEAQGVAATPRRPGDPVALTPSAAAPRTPAELPPGAVSATPGSLPAPGTQRVMIDGQPVDMSPDMLEWTNRESTARNVWTDSGRQERLVGTCTTGSVACTAHATDGSNRGFAFERKTPDMSVQDAMSGLALRSRFNRFDSTVSVNPTAKETEQIAADNLANQARNARNAENVSTALSYVPVIGGPIRVLRGANYITRELFPTRPLAPSTPREPAGVLANGTTRTGATTGGGVAAAERAPGGVATLTRPDNPAFPPAGGPGPRTGPGPRDTTPDTGGGPARPNLYQPDGTIQQWDPETKTWRTIAGPGDGTPEEGANDPAPGGKPPGAQPPDERAAPPGIEGPAGTPRPETTPPTADSTPYNRNRTWPVAGDVPGAAGGKVLSMPNARHTISGARATKKIVENNSIYLRGYEHAASKDLADIASGQARVIDNDGRRNQYLVNDRIYEVKPGGETFPVSGVGVAKLGRIEYKALVEIAKAGGDVDSVGVFRYDPAYIENPDAIARAKRIWDGTF